MIKIAHKHGVRLEAIHPAEQVKNDLPAIRNIQTKSTVKPDTLCDKFGKCIRDKHNARSLKDVTDLTKNIPVSHRRNRKCRCMKCAKIRWDSNYTCKHPNKCIERARELLNSMKDKWNPTCSQPPEFFTNPTPEEVGSIPDPTLEETIHTLNPFRVETTLKDCFRVFTDDSQPPPEMTLRAPRTRSFEYRPVEIYTDGSCINNGETTARAGGGIWFSENNERNASFRVPGPDQSNNTGELHAILRAITSVPKDMALTIKTDSMYAVSGLTTYLEKWEDQGWMYSKHPELFKCITAWVRYRSNTTEIVWVKGHNGIRGNMEADKLAGEGALMDQTEAELTLNPPANMIPSGVKLTAMSQKDFYRGIKKKNRPPPRRSSEINIGRIQACVAEEFGLDPTPETIWKTTKHKDLTKKTREFLWKCIHDAFKIGKFWSKIENYKHRGLCAHCESEESMEYILTECDAPGREQIWSLANELWNKRSPEAIPTSYGTLLGCCLSNYKKQNGKPNKGLNRLFRIIVSESMYMIWKIRCERTISWNNNPTKSHSSHKIHNKWLQAINARLKMDSVQTNTKIFKKKTLDPKTILRTWKNCLKDNLHDTRNWCGGMGVLVGIVPKRPPGRNR